MGTSRPRFPPKYRMYSTLFSLTSTTSIPGHGTPRLCASSRDPCLTGMREKKERDLQKAVVGQETVPAAQLGKEKVIG